MRLTRILAMCLCLPATGLFAQTASLQAPHTPGTTRSSGAINFNYDAQHDQLLASGVSFNATHSQNTVAPTTGTVMVTLNINPSTKFEKGTSFHCSLIVIGGLLDLNNGTVDGGIETANGVAKNGVCTLKIPYSWTLPPDSSADTGMVVAFGVSAVTDGDKPRVRRSTLQLDGIENLPANGATTTMSFDVVL